MRVRVRSINMGAGLHIRRPKTNVAREPPQAGLGAAFFFFLRDTTFFLPCFFTYFFFALRLATFFFFLVVAIVWTADSWCRPSSLRAVACEVAGRANRAAPSAR